MTMYELNNREAFDELISLGVVIVNFSADYCYPCRLLYDNIKNADERYGSRVLFLKADVGKFKKLADRYEVSSIPSLFFMMNGKVVNSSVGTISTGEIISYVEEALHSA